MSKNFTWPVSAYLYDDYVKLKECLELNKKKLENKQLIIFGAGIRGCVFGKLLSSFGYSSFIYVDNNKDKWDGYIFDENHPIKSSDYLLEDNKDKVILVSIESIELVEEQLKSLGYKENENLFYVVTDVYGDFVKEFSRTYTNNTLVIGDCGLSQISIQDTQHKCLGNMLQDKLGYNKCKVLSVHGMGMRSFYNLFKLQVINNHKPKKLVLMTNFEIFTKIHHILPRTQHAKLFEKLSNDIDLTFSAEWEEYCELVNQRSSTIQIETMEYKVDETTNHNEKMVFKMNYMYRLSEKVEDSIYLSKLLEYAKEQNVEVLCFIPPANYQFAEQCHENFKEKYDKNRKILTKWVNDLGVPMLDLSYVVESDGFADVRTIDETCNQKGREIVLDLLVDAIMNGV